MRILARAGLLAALALAPAPLAAFETVWPMFQGGADHAGYRPLTLIPANFSLQWQKTVAPGFALNPVSAADGKVFVSAVVYFDPGPSLFALDAADGAELWSKDFGDIFSVNPPSYGAGKVYVQTGNHGSDTYLRAYDATTGELVFRSPHTAQWERYFSPTLFAGKVYVNGGYYGGMYAFDGSDGTQLWFNSGLPQYDEWTPAVDDTYAYAYLGEYSPGLYVIGRQSGTLAFRIADPNFDWNGWSMDLAPVLGPSGVLVIHNGRLLCFDVANRRIRYEIAGGFTGQPSLSDGVVYVIQAGALSARDEATGDQLWLWEAPGESLIGTIVVTDSHLFARTGTKTYAVDLATHQAVWSHPASGHLALGNTSLYIAGGDGNLTAIALQPYATPVAAAGADRVVFDRVTLDGSASHDPDGQIVSWSWNLKHREDPSADLSAAGEVCELSDLRPGFYDVTLTVVDDGGFNDKDTFLLAVAGSFASQLVANPSFEEGDLLPTFWAGSGLGPEDRLVTTTALDGSRSFKIKGSAAVKNLSQSINGPGQAGTLFSLSGWSRASRPALLGGFYGLQATILYSDGTHSTYRSGFSKRTHGWEFRGLTFRAAREWQSVKVSVRYVKQAGTAWFDAVRLFAN